MGTKKPQLKQKNPATISKKSTSLRGRESSANVILVWREYRLHGRTVRLVSTSRLRIKKAHIRMAQPNPTSEISRESMIGKMTPPRLVPVNATPIAVALFRWNHPAAAVMARSVSTLIPPCNRRTRVEEHCASNSRAKSLGEKHLVV